MTAAPPRPADQRKADTLAMLGTPEIDVWVATASADGTAHLVPLSLAWIDDRVVIAVESGSTTGCNLLATGRARLGLGPTRDVVIIDSELDGSTGVHEAPAALADGYVAQVGSDPRSWGDDYVFVRLRPLRLQAWREANEIAGRTLMREGSWIV